MCLRASSSLHRSPSERPPDRLSESTPRPPSVSQPTSVGEPRRSLPGPPVQRPRRTSESSGGELREERRRVDCVVFVAARGRPGARSRRTGPTPRAAPRRRTGGKPQVSEDAVDRGRILDRSDEPHGAGTARADENLEAEGPLQQHAPREPAFAPRVVGAHQRRRHRPLRPATGVGGQRRRAGGGWGWGWRASLRGST